MYAKGLKHSFGLDVVKVLFKSLLYLMNRSIQGVVR